jgi:hypothetical protein
VRRKYAVDAVHYVDELAKVRRRCTACWQGLVCYQLPRTRC